MTLDSPLTDVRKIDTKHKEALKRLGLKTVRDLLFYFPVKYEDFSTITPINKMVIGKKNTIQGVIKEIKNSTTRRKNMVITNAMLEDDTGALPIVWFRQPYLESFLKTGTYVTLTGTIEHGYNGLQMTSPAYEKYKEESIHSGRIVPVYSETANITSKWLRFFLKPLLKHAKECPEFIPKSIIDSYALIPLDLALNEIHFPSSKKELGKARKRLAFQEMFLLQIAHLFKRARFQKERATAIPFDEELIRDFVTTLPFTLTDDQKKTAWQIFKDIEKDEPMNRLLEGDVGSGKTVVAALALFLTSKRSLQSLVLAPTEILAMQHFNSLKKLFRKSPIELALYTRTQHHTKDGETTEEELIEKLAGGHIDVAVGTHTLLKQEVSGKNIGLVIVDEQHRFGVKQRAELKKSSTSKTKPHFLSMTATPIPRTLALALYGDLDISIIKEMPKNRKTVQTQLVSPYDREKMYDFIKEKIDQGEQAFVVCPLIEESDTLGVKSVTEEYKKLNTHVFPDVSIDLLHGKLKKDEKESVMQRFMAKKTSILVSTSVIEVGIDVPNATIMMIEGAERFGLSQLHQFRGRVGRGDKQSYCFLFSESPSNTSFERLKTLESVHSGFELSEKDLEMRGPGEVYGVRQSGLPDLKMASLSDATLIAETREAASTIIKESASLKKFPALKRELNSFEKTVHFE
ncbi:ATP-dependent DNA helicase RecG [Patescibacteria group bacterium]|nr:ATP-dependent DNA helicase RecG [Patescibacteria group bacterium]